VWWSLLALATGCSDYKFGGDPDAGEPVEETDTADDSDTDGADGSKTDTGNPAGTDPDGGSGDGTGDGGSGDGSDGTGGSGSSGDGSSGDGTADDGGSGDGTDPVDTPGSDGWGKEDLEDSGFDEDVFCAAAADDPTILDDFETPGDDHVLYCHNASCNGYVLVDSNIDSCLTHLDHSCDVFSREYGCGS
jgi:hypothetical protein